MILERSFYERDARAVAPELLNKVLVAGPRSGWIVEVEAYAGEEDEGSHGHRGMTRRTEVMFGPPGHLYVYFTYGMHWCANAVCGPDGVCSAVLPRALEPLSGVDAMWQARPKARRERDLASGPAKLTQALGIGGTHNGADLVAGDAGVAIHDDGTPPPVRPERSRRIGLTRGVEHEWRWCVPGNEHVSR